jgi:hypothetical protein
VKIGEKIRRLFRREPLTAEQLAARLEAESLREQRNQNEAAVKSESESRILGSGGPF